MGLAVADWSIGFDVVGGVGAIIVREFSLFVSIFAVFSRKNDSFRRVRDKMGYFTGQRSFDDWLQII